MFLSDEAVQRFMAKIKYDGDCWIWQGATNGPGNYGHMGVPGRKTMTTHRVSYLHFIGPIPDGLDVLHSCDRTLCVNPDHLFTGTDEDNKKDMERKGRQRDLTKRTATGQFAAYLKPLPIVDDRNDNPDYAAWKDI
jgi:hypothetical protein